MKKNFRKKTTGVVIGKFYPPHLGHKYLIDTALSKVDQLTVIVCYKKPGSINESNKNGQIISGELRAKWLKQIHPNIHKVIVIDDIYPDDDSALWASKTIEWLGFVPDYVFTSESYGEPYSRLMGSIHVSVDQARTTIPISATKVRSNPIKYLKYLNPIVQAYFIKRIALVGAESSGKTTLSKDLAIHFKTNWVPEYGRMYAEGKLFHQHQSWSTKDFEFIAQQQNILEDKLAESANKVLICDTNAFATSIWHERYMEQISIAVQKLAENRRYDLIIVTDASIPFEQDGTRDGEHIRAWMQQRFIDELRKQHIPYIFLSGDRKSRLLKAVKIIDNLLKQSYFDTFELN